MLRLNNYMSPIRDQIANIFFPKVRKKDPTFLISNGMKKPILLFCLLFFLGIGISAQAETLGEKRNFYIESSYDLSQREELTAVLIKTTPQLYFYADEKWWNFSPQNIVYQALTDLEEEFENKIYPTLTLAFGSEWKPGIDKDSHITVLIHPMDEEAGGYFKSGDEYPRLQVSNSNEREMIYLNSDFITDPISKSFLAHEFLHLITFNQKVKQYDTEEEIWLNEARAEYVPTLLGYDEKYEGSNLQKRVRIFLENPSDSITEWQSKKTDYGALNLFTQYLVDHYGVKILANSLHSKLTGIPSLNEALKENGFSKDLSQIFVDWTIAVSINDCLYGEKYCYLNQNLKDLYVIPSMNFLPLTGESTLSVTNITKDWSGNWYKFVGGKGDLKLEFAGSSWVNFKVPYIIKNIQGDYLVSFLSLDKNQKGEIYIPDFGTKNTSLIIIPSVQSKISGFSGSEPIYSFFWSASNIKEPPQPQSQPEPEPQPEPKPQPQPQPEPEPQLEPQLNPQLQPQPEPQLEPQPEPDKGRLIIKMFIEKLSAKIAEFKARLTDFLRKIITGIQFKIAEFQANLRIWQIKF